MSSGLVPRSHDGSAVSEIESPCNLRHCSPFTDSLLLAILYKNSSSDAHKVASFWLGSPHLSLLPALAVLAVDARDLDRVHDGHVALVLEVQLLCQEDAPPPARVDRGELQEVILRVLGEA